MMLPAARVLVTGLRSFTGHYLDLALRAEGAQVFGTLAPAEAAAAAAKGDDVGKAGTWFVADLLDQVALKAAVRQAKPTHVVHLAAISFVGHDDVDDIYRTNVVGTRNLLGALHGEAAASLQAVVLASSANIYGNASVDPIAVTTPPAPVNDYAVSKLAMEYAARLWHPRLPITLVRPFNYTGVGQSANFLVPKIVGAFRQRSATLELGNLDVERDFSDVRDVADAYTRLLASAPPREGLAAQPRIVNICSGQATSLRQILDSAARLSGHQLQVQVNPAFVRSDEVKRLRGDPAPLNAALAQHGGWQPRPFADTLAWMLS